jgi:hypothetical protein
MTRRALALLPLLPCVLAAQYGTHPKPSEQDYPAHIKAEKVSVGAEFMVHSFSNGRDSYIAKDYLVVEVALFPVKGQTLAVEAGQFTLLVNGRKQALASQAPEFVAASLKYPDWETRPRAQASAGPVIFGAPAPVERFPGDPSARTGPMPPRAPQDDPSGLGKEPPVTPDELAVQTALPDGQYHDPVSGYLYFAWRGKTKSIRSLTLEFTGPAGEVTLPLL